MSTLHEAPAGVARDSRDDETPPASRTRARLTATSLLLVALAMIQSAGQTMADTKLDLVVNPWGMLERSLTMWDRLGAFGQVGNQSYGYLWPMGPFFGIGEALSLPSWVVQRLWMALVLVVAFQGAARVARALGVRSDVALVLTGLAYALSPRLLTTVGPISIEAWPSALAPWVLLSLVHGSRHGSARSYAIGAGLAVGMVGGVNAAATFAVIPLGAVWLLTRAPGPRRRTLMLWWPLATLVACAWWLVPLVLLGRYSPPFLDYIETAAVTTYTTTPFDALRGTTAWIPYLDGRWQAGNALVTEPALIINTAALVALGVLGIARGPREHRAFLSLGLLVGMLMVTAGHLGPYVGWFAGDVHTALDGALAPFRNVHKFDPVIRLPMVLGLGFLLDTSVRAWRDRPAVGAGLGSAPLRGVVVIAVLALVGATTPAITGRLAPTQSFTEIPGYWKDAASWLGAQDRDDRALLVPASPFGAYLWGDTRDEPLQPLATRPWGVRNAIPLSTIGNLRALDVVEERLNRGEPSAGLATYLRRMGVTYLVVRNDLQSSNALTDPALVHQALDGSPGIEPAASFGPPVGGDAVVENEDGVLTVDSGWQSRYDAIEIYEVTGEVAPAVTATTVPVVAGAPEDLLPLADRDVLADQPTRLAYDVDPEEPASDPVVLTDGLRLRDAYYGSVHDGSSPTLTADEANALDDRRDYVLTDDRRWMTDAVLEGATAVTASSSLADADTAGGARTQDLPYAALDGDPATGWVSAPATAGRPSLRVTYPRDVYVSGVTVTTTSDSAEGVRVRVTTARGASEVATLDPGVPLAVPVPAGDTGWVELAEASENGAQLAVAELDVPGTSVTRWLRPPAVPDAWGAPDAISLDARPDVRTGCVEILAAVRCAPDRGRLGGEETAAMRRLVRVPEPGDYEVQLRAVPRPGSAVPDLLQADRFARADASSRANAAVSASSALAAIDGDPGTTWISAATDPDPTLDLSWLQERLVSGVRVELEEGAAAARPTELVVSYPGGSQEVTLDDDGTAALPRPVRTDRISLAVRGAVNTVNVNDAQTVTPVGVGISEVEVDGVPGLLFPLGGDEERDLGCGSGPAFVGPDGARFRTAVTASLRDVHLGRPVDLRVCGSDTVRLEAGENRLQLLGDEAFSPASVVLTRTDAALPVDEPTAAGPTGHRWEVADGARLFVARHNENDGWEAADAGGRALEPVVVDGWQQGFWLTGDTGDTGDTDDTDGTAATTVDLDFGPTTLYRAALLGGGIALLLLALLWLWGRRRRRVDPADDAPPLVPARSAPLVAAAGWVVGAGFLAGWWGVLVLAVSGVALATLRRRGVTGWWWPALVPIGVIAAWYALQPWGSERGWGGADGLPQLLTMVPLALLGVSTLADGPWRRSRWTGSSTRR